MSVKKGLVPNFFDGIDVNPTLAVLAVYFGPDVILAVPHPAHSATNCTTQHAEAVGPFADTPSSSLEEDKGIAVTGEALVSLALSVGALVDFDTVGATGLLVGKRSSHANSNGGCMACTTLGVVDPLEERAFEPLHEGSDDTVLVAPGGLSVGS